MKRRPPASDEEAKEPPSPPAIGDPPTWPAASSPEKVEVALFIIPGPVKPWSSVIDVRSASRLQIAGFESPALDSTDAQPADGSANELPLNTEPARPAPSGTVPDLALFAEEGGHVPVVHPAEAFTPETLDVFPSERPEEAAVESPALAVSLSQVFRRWLAWCAAVLSAVGATVARLWSKMLAHAAGWASSAGGYAGRTLNAVRSRFGPEDRAAAWKSALATASALKIAVAQRSAKAGARLATTYSASSAIVIPALRRAQSRAAIHARGCHTAVVAMPAIRRRQIGFGIAAAATLLLAMGIVRLAQVTMGSFESSSQNAGTVPLAERPLIAFASLAPGFSDGTRAVEPSATAERERRAEEARPPAAAPAVVPAAAPRSRPAEAQPAEPRSARVPPADSGPRVADAGAVADNTAAAAAPPANVAPEAPDNAAAPATARLDEGVRPDSPTPPEPAIEPPVPAPVSSPAAAAPAAVGPSTPAAGVSASDGIAETLKHLQVAYERRDATLAKAVWPTVDERALARAFDGLRSQSVTFDRCQLNVTGAAGEVECRGVTRYVPRVGGQYQRVESRQWKFRVQKGADSWLITSAAAR